MSCQNVHCSAPFDLGVVEIPIIYNLRWFPLDVMSIHEASGNGKGLLESVREEVFTVFLNLVQSVAVLKELSGSAVVF